MSRKKPRSPGISLRNRGAGLFRFTDEMNTEGGKQKIRRQVRLAARRETRRIAADETGQ